MRPFAHIKLVCASVIARNVAAELALTHLAPHSPPSALHDLPHSLPGQRRPDAGVSRPSHRWIPNLTELLQATAVDSVKMRQPVLGLPINYYDQGFLKRCGKADFLKLKLKKEIPIPELVSVLIVLWLIAPLTCFSLCVKTECPCASMM